MAVFLYCNIFLIQSFTSLLGEKSVFFSVIASKSLKSSLFDICRTRLELKAWSPYIKDATVESRGVGDYGIFKKLYFDPPKLGIIYIGLLKNFRENILARKKFYSPPPPL